jgi:hypothetical protein
MKNDVPEASGKLRFVEIGDLKISAVYFLFKSGEVIYIGQSTNLLNRLSSHDKEFDAVGYIPAPRDLLTELEGYWIAAFQPEQNRGGIMPLFDFVHPELIKQQDAIWKAIRDDFKAKYKEWINWKAVIIHHAEKLNRKFQDVLIKKGVEPHRVLEYTKRTFGWAAKRNQKIVQVETENGIESLEAEELEGLTPQQANKQWEAWKQEELFNPESDMNHNGR